MSALGDAALAVLVVGAVVLLGAYAVVALERAAAMLVSGAPISRAGVLVGPARSAALLALQERRETEHPDAEAWALAPALLAGLGALMLTVVPFSATASVAADTEAGFVVFAAAVGLVMVAVYLHGWSANSLFPLIGGYRFVAQALSFQIPLLLALLATALPAESLAVGEIVRAQEHAWNVVRQPAGLPLYLVVAVGVSFWGPLNTSDAPDLIGGTVAEVSGSGRLLWEGARAAVLLGVAAMGAAAWLGGYWGPLLPGWAWMVAKTLVLLVVLVASRHLLARVPIERFVGFAWVVLIPVALANVFVSGIFLL